MQDLKLYINSLECDLPPDLSIEFENSIADFSDVGSRRGSIVKDITLPFTERNAIATGYAENIESSTRVNQNTLNTFILESSSGDITGYVKVQQVEDGYTITLLKDNADWLTLLQDLKLSDIDLSEYDHVRNYANVVASWTNTALPYDLSFVYDVIDRGQAVDISIHEMYPMLQMYRLLQKILNGVGYQLSSSYLTGADFKALYLSFANEDLIIPEAERLKRYFNMRPLGATSYIPYEGAMASYGFSIAMQYSGFTGAYKGAYILYTPATGLWFEYSQATETLFEAKINIENESASITNGVTVYILAWNPLTAPSIKIITHSISTIAPLTTVEFSLTHDNNVVIASGDHVWVAVQVTSGAFNNLKLLQANSYFKSIPTNKCCEGASVDWSVNMPDMTQIDFIKLVKTVSNTMFLSDINTRTIYAEPLDSFFLDDTQALNWSSKVNMNEPVRVEYFDEQKELIFDWKEDSEDGYYAVKKRKEPAKYGENLQALDNKYSDNSKYIGNEIASGTIFETARALGFRITPVAKIWKDIEHAELSQKNNIRIFAYDGIVSLNGSDKWLFKYNLQLVGVGTSQVYYTTYPKLRPLFWNDVNIEGTNYYGLFETHYRGLYRIINEGEKRTFPVYLTLPEKLSYDPRKLIYIDIPKYGGSYYILNKLTGTYEDSGVCLAECVPYNARTAAPIYRGVLPVAEQPSQSVQRVGLSLQYDTNGDIIIQSNGSAMMRINPTTLELQQGGSFVYSQDSLGNVYQVYSQDSLGNIYPVKIST